MYVELSREFHAYTMYVQQMVSKKKTSIENIHVYVYIAAEIQAELINSGVIMDFSREYKRPITAHVQCTLETKTTFWVYTCTMWNIVLQSRRF